MDAATLVPYLPRLVLDWQREAPGRAHRAIDGSLVFVDISGFTKMSERLARQGKRGAEEVTDVLGSTFARLLAVAYENGGGLIKFGGDALLLFFSDAEHEARACHAAAGMRARLREMGAIATSAGAIRLRMSVGVNSGAFDFFLAGASHRELIVAGPSATTTVAMEQAATAGEIMAGPATVAALDARILGAERDGGTLLRRAPAPPRIVSSGGGSTRVEPSVVARFVPRAIRRHLQGGGSEQEHRMATVAFIKFEGVDDALARDGTERVAADLDALVRCVQEAADDHGVCFVGTDVDRNGGKVILVAGAPHASDDDEDRMLRTLRSVLDGEHAFRLRAGVNRGHVFAGDVGPEYRRTYTVMGDAVNLAARLMARAEPEQILATPAVIGRASTRFELLLLESFHVKGKKKPVNAVAVGRMRGMRRASAGDEVPLVGRDKEIRLLAEALEAARSGGGRVVEIVGDAGLGKSRIVRELESRTPCRIVACDPYEASTPYAALRRFIRAIAGIPEDTSPAAAGDLLAAAVGRSAAALRPWLPLLAIPAGAEVAPTAEAAELAPEFRAARLRETFASFAEAMLGEPEVVVFDDAHWMDEASGAALATLLERVASSRAWLVVVARRPGSAGFVPGHEARPLTIALEPLAREAAATLVAHASADLPQPRVEALVERAAGHPMFLLELAAAGGEQLPDSVESAVAARIDTLAPRDRTLLRYAAVCGTSVEVALLREIVDDVELDDGVWKRLAEFVEPAGDAVRFRQALIRDAAYENLPFRRRTELHRRAGEALERRGRDGDLALIALHFARAEDHAKTWRYARSAGDRARDAFANADAATLYRSALAASRRLAGLEPGAIAATWRSLGDVYELGGLYPEAIEAYGSARKVAPPPMLPALMHKEGTVRERLGRYGDALRWFARGLRALDAIENEREREVERLTLVLARANAHLRRGRYREGIRDAEPAAELAERHGRRPELAKALFLLNWAFLDLGRPEAPTYAERALALFQKVGDLVGQAHVLNSLGATRFFEGRWEEAVALYEQSRDAAERAGHVILAATVTNNIAEILSDRGDFDDAERLFRDALRVWRGARYQAGVAVASSNLARLAARLGRYEEAHRLYDEARAAFVAVGEETSVVEVDARIAESYVLAGDANAALETADRAARRAESLGGLKMIQVLLCRVRGAAWLRRGDPARSLALLQESLRYAEELDAQYEMALTLRALAAHARATGGDPEPPARRSEEIFARLGVHRMGAPPRT